MGPAAPTAEPLLLRVQFAESSHPAEKRCRAEVFDPFLQAPASLLLHNGRLRWVAANRSARQAD
jgi:hypothetical protein